MINIKGTAAIEIVYPFIFCLLLILFVFRIGYFSMIMNNKFMYFFGKYIYSTYVMSEISCIFLYRCVWGNIIDVNSMPYLVIVISMFFSIVIGIIVYHFIEEPMRRFLNIKYKKICINI